MAFDKVVDSAVLESGLTSIANAIREKAGTSDALAFPAGFAAAIAAIESGGGGNYKVTYGKFTPAEDITIGDTGEYGIEHGLGEKPSLFLLVSSTRKAYALRSYILLNGPGWTYPKGYRSTSISSAGSNSAYHYNLANGVAGDSLGETEVKIIGLSTTVITADDYYWIALGGELIW